MVFKWSKVWIGIYFGKTVLSLQKGLLKWSLTKGSIIFLVCMNFIERKGLQEISWRCKNSFQKIMTSFLKLICCHQRQANCISISNKANLKSHSFLNLTDSLRVRESSLPDFRRKFNNSTTSLTWPKNIWNLHCWLMDWNLIYEFML